MIALGISQASSEVHSLICLCNFLNSIWGSSLTTKTTFSPNRESEILSIKKWKERFLESLRSICSG